MRLASPAFRPGGPIPARHTCKGADLRPELVLEDVPPGAHLAFLMEDPDAPRGTWLHWTAWDLPPGTARLPEGAALGTEGTTSARSVGWHGPCPPSGTHRYFFRAYALDRPLGLPRGATREQFEEALRGRVVAQAELMGTFAR